MVKIKELLGEVNGEDVIDIGDIVNVTTLKGGEIYGRLNALNKNEIKVGMIIIKVDNIINIERGRGKVVVNKRIPKEIRKGEMAGIRMDIDPLKELPSHKRLRALMERKKSKKKINKKYKK